MLDLEPLSGGGFRDAYATHHATLESGADGVLLIAEYDGTMVSLPLAADAMVPVIRHAVVDSNMLETRESLTPPR